MMKRLSTILTAIICAILPGMAQTYIEYVDSADYYIRNERWKDAERATISALRKMPANKLNFLLWSNLGDIRTRLGDYDGALQAFEIGLASNPGSTKLLCNRAYTLLACGKTDEAIADINEALANDSILEWPLKMRGIISLGKGDYNTAEKDFNTLRRHYPQNADAYSGLGKIEAMKGNTEEAISLLRKSLDLEQNEDTWFYLVLVNIESNRIPAAKEDLFTALKRYPRSGNLYLLRGVIHKKNFENDAAMIDKKIARDYGADPHLIDKFLPEIKQ